VGRAPVLGDGRQSRRHGRPEAGVVLLTQPPGEAGDRGPKRVGEIERRSLGSDLLRCGHVERLPISSFVELIVSPVVGHTKWLEWSSVAKKSAGSKPGTWATAMHSIQLDLTDAAFERTSSISVRENSAGNSARGQRSSTSRTAPAGRCSAPAPRTSMLMPRLAMRVS